MARSVLELGVRSGDNSRVEDKPSNYLQGQYRQSGPNHTTENKHMAGNARLSRTGDESKRRMSTHVRAPRHVSNKKISTKLLVSYGVEKKPNASHDYPAVSLPPCHVSGEIQVIKDRRRNTLRKVGVIVEVYKLLS